ncbi:hypothetical protein L6258_03085 [Candidatus Parcubacteria bacterium]|nr:hypothetical protein [Candidatus Parcubacteria bacterium]
MGDDDIGGGVDNRAGQEDDTLFEEPAVDIVNPLEAPRVGLDYDRNRLVSNLVVIILIMELVFVSQ